MKLNTSEHTAGIISATAAYVLWGILPLYWKLVYDVPSEEVLAHRIAWSLVFLLCILFATAKLTNFFQELNALVKQRKKLLGVSLASVVITINWFTYIWAVNNDHIIEASLGYYINPLVNVLLGIIVLKEKLSFWQLVSVFLAFIGVLILTLQLGSMPWVALTLAISFGFYGLLKKLANLGAISGLTAETLIITPFAMIFIGYLHVNGTGVFGLGDLTTAGLLIGAGVATAVPLLLFASGARRIPLSMIGILQYIAPTITLIIGVFLFHEPFTKVHLISFMFIWSALVVFTLSRTKLMIQLEPKFLQKNKSLGS